MIELLGGGWHAGAVRLILPVSGRSRSRDAFRRQETVKSVTGATVADGHPAG
jgi:hypothetical protein